MLVHLMDNHKPIGPQEWLALEKEYNKQVKTNSSVECDYTLLRKKQDTVSFEY